MDRSYQTLLLVEDEAIIATTEAELLLKEGYTVIIAYTGESALEILRVGTVKIDLILMDIDLGNGMDGIDTAREMMKFQDIPVVFLSSHSEKTIMKKAKSVNSYGYVVKYLIEDELLNTIEKALKLYAAQRVKKI